jgi:hypothetical protein
LHRRRLITLIAVSAMLATALPACSSQHTTDLQMAPLEQMPAQVQSAPLTVQQAYQFASANPDLMQHIPCYCGCGSIGHTSNYSCYFDQDGNFDSHALGCSICVDITQDAMRLLKEGRTVPEIKATVDSTYSKYGTSNMP